MLQWLFGALDLLSDVPRTLKAWLIGLAIAAAVVLVSLAIDRFVLAA